MVRHFLTTLFVFASLTVCGQKKIENELSEKHQNIKGSKVSLIAPSGFTNGLNFLDLQQTESGSSIMILDLPGPYSEISKELTKENMLSKGVEVKSRKTC